MQIRKAKVNDAKGSFNVIQCDFGKHISKKDFELSSKNKDVVYLVLEDKKQIIGYILAFIVPTCRSEALIHEVRILSQYRGKNLGKKLVDACCKELFKRKVKSIYAEIEKPLETFYCTTCKFKKVNNWIEVVKTKN
jgi:N-acetylglutamate synthase-like GNAT family acetyltransferase